MLISPGAGRLRDDKALLLVAAVLIVVTTSLVGFAAFGLEALSEVRAYVGGEGLWSKAQKDAAFHLARYATTRDEEYYRRALAAFAVPLGDHRARLELDKPSPDLSVAYAGFLAGGNDPKDVAGLARLYLRFHRVPYMARAIAIWRQGDEYIAALEDAGERLHAALTSAHPDPTAIRSILNSIDLINARVTALENSFSATLGQAARWMRGLLVGVIAGVALVLVGMGVFVARRLFNQVRRSAIALRQAHKMEAVGRLAGGVAHDFNNLLTAILGSADFLLEALPADPERAEAEEIHAAALRAAELTRQLLAFSRQQVLAPRVLDVNEVVAGMDKMLHRLIGENIDLQTTFARPLGAVRADRGQLEQVIVNLVVNARDALPKGGRISLETAAVDFDKTRGRDDVIVTPGPYVMLAVSDNGTGMDAETRARIFEPFFTTKELGKGTGLGLSTVYGIVKQSGGYIWVHSEPGQGARFEAYFPKVAATPEVAPEGAKLAAVVSDAGTILVVEDQPEVRRLIQKVLAARGYEVLSAGAGAEALQVAERFHGQLDLLITDAVMPGMSGREVALRLTAAIPGIKTLLVSGYAEGTVVHDGVVDPGIAFLRKPFTPEALVRKVREVLQTPPGANSA